MKSKLAEKRDSEKSQVFLHIFSFQLNIHPCVIVNSKGARDDLLMVTCGPQSTVQCPPPLSTLGRGDCRDSHLQQREVVR